MLFAVGDVEAKAACRNFDLLRRRAAPRRNVGMAARRTASDRFCASRVIPIYEEYYERVLARNPPGDRKS